MCVELFIFLKGEVERFLFYYYYNQFEKSKQLSYYYYYSIQKVRKLQGLNCNCPPLIFFFFPSSFFVNLTHFLLFSVSIFFSFLSSQIILILSFPQLRQQQHYLHLLFSLRLRDHHHPSICSLRLKDHQHHPFFWFITINIIGSVSSCCSCIASLVENITFTAPPSDHLHLQLTFCS